MNLTHVRKERPEKTTNNNIKKKDMSTFISLFIFHHKSIFMFYLGFLGVCCFVGLFFECFFLLVSAFLSFWFFYWLGLFACLFLLDFFSLKSRNYSKASRSASVVSYLQAVFLVIIAVIPNPFLDILKPEGCFSLGTFGVLKNIFHYSKNTLPGFSTAVSGNSEWFAHLLLQ